MQIEFSFIKMSQKDKNIKEKLFGKRAHSKIEKDHEEEKCVSPLKVAVK